jgi:hypothetical protein
VQPNFLSARQKQTRHISQASRVTWYFRRARTLDTQTLGGEHFSLGVPRALRSISRHSGRLERLAFDGLALCRLLLLARSCQSVWHCLGRRDAALLSFARDALRLGFSLVRALSTPHERGDLKTRTIGYRGLT